VTGFSKPGLAVISSKFDSWCWLLQGAALLLTFNFKQTGS